MYLPAHFAISERRVLVELMTRYSFATLVTVGADGSPSAGHIPLLVDAEGERVSLLGHVARANPQWRELERDALVIFHGPHAYISPAWYRDVPADMAVPTWNYAAVHATVRGRLLDDDATAALVTRLTDVHEAGRETPWAADLTAPRRRAMLRAIVGFALEVKRLEGKLKVGQNRSTADRLRVADELAASPHADVRDLASMTRGAG